MIVDELLLNGGAHAFQRIEGTLEISLEGLAGRDDLVHDVKSLLLAYTRAKLII